MGIRSILVPLNGGKMDARCLATAATLAKRYNAHILALFAAADPRVFPIAFVADGAGYLSDSFLLTLQEQIDRQRKAAETTFTAWRQASGFADPSVSGNDRPSAALKIEIGEDTNLVRQYGVVADLVVAPLPADGGAESAIMLEAALFDAGRPVLAVPPGNSPSPPPDAPVAIAWNGSPESARALNAALPLLSSASEVTVLHAGVGDRQTLLNPVIEYLDRHGIAAHATDVPDHGNTGKALLDEAGRLGAGLLVMGAYSHSRARQFIFGGATSYIFHHATLPVLVAH
jgi:nucleotide-binding universal stress UspA family protein